MSDNTNQLDKIDHIVVVMLENRSFDHMLGFLYSDSNNITPRGHAYEGLTGNESNPDADQQPIKVFKIPNNPNNPGQGHPYFWPGSDPGEGYDNTNTQLFTDKNTPPAHTVATNQGFIKDYQSTLQWQRQTNQQLKNSPTDHHGYHHNIIKGTHPTDIMGMYTPELLPVLSTLAKQYAVCDHWYCSLPTETLPNRAFVQTGTSLGRLSDDESVYDVPTIYNHLEQNQTRWAIFGDSCYPVLTRMSYPQLPKEPKFGQYGKYSDFARVAANAELPNYTFLTPDWGYEGNSQHPNYDVAKGEQYLLRVYRTLRDAPQWDKTLLIITYDEHGGTYDHVSPPENAIAPNNGDYNEYFNFNFQRYGVRVPAVLVSPLIEPHSVFRAKQPDNDKNGQSPGHTPLDHTSILATVEQRFNVKPLTERDECAQSVADVLTLTQPRTDDPMAKVIAPMSNERPSLEDDRDWHNSVDHLTDMEVQLAANLTEQTNDNSGGHYHFDHQNDASQWVCQRYHQHYGDCDKNAEEDPCCNDKGHQ